MTILTLEFLDKIISILKTQNKKLTESEITTLFITDSFYRLYKKDFQLDNYLPILLNDKYIKEEVEKSDLIDGLKIKYYSLTPEALNFVGYVNTNYGKLSLEQENKLLRLSQIQLNKSTIRTNNLMLIFNFLIAFGAIIASVYYIREIFCYCNK
jgi:hypothetical protein